MHACSRLDRPALPDEHNVIESVLLSSLEKLTFREYFYDLKNSIYIFLLKDYLVRLIPNLTLILQSSFKWLLPPPISHSSTCCVFRPAFGYPKAGGTTFFSRFQPFLFILNFFSDFTPEINNPLELFKRD